MKLNTERLIKEIKSAADYAHSRTLELQIRGSRETARSFFTAYITLMLLHSALEKAMIDS